MPLLSLPRRLFFGLAFISIYSVPHSVDGFTIVHGGRRAALSTQLHVIDGGKGKSRQQEMLDFIEQPMGSTVGEEDIKNMDNIDPDVLELVKSIVEAADSRKADDIRCLGVAHVTTLTDAMVVVTGNSRPQNQAIAAAIEEAVEEIDEDNYLADVRVEGTADSGWMLLDYGLVMVHIMTPKSRLFYDIEGQWKQKGGKFWDIVDEWLVPNSVVESVDLSNGVTEAEDDPFWS